MNIMGLSLLLVLMSMIMYCLEQLRDYLPTYMGVMGSQKRIHYAFEVLREQGWTQEELDMVYAPMV